MDGVTDLREALPNGDTTKPCIHIEVCQKQFSNVKPTQVNKYVEKYVSSHPRLFSGESSIKHFQDQFLQDHVDSLTICQGLELAEEELQDLTGMGMCIHVYTLSDDGAAQEELEGEDLAAANHWVLPSADFHGLWESLVFDSNIKSQLLQYSRTTLLFSDKKVDSNIVSWNRVILLHGPPGTGKTSLCKALAQKLCIHLSDRYTYGQLIEINSHSLFSKWFSESGKLVMKMFQKIQEFVDDQDSLVCVLIDEVESLTAARKAALSGTEPSDAIRVVNALLTQLDQIKKNPNVIILTTSNITGAIDLAFVDRADIKQYIGPPSPAAIYKIFQSCITELMKTGIIHPSEPIVDFNKISSVGGYKWNKSAKLKEISVNSEGLSGRTLRKVPFIAHALYLQKPQVNFGEFLEALAATVVRQFQEREDLARV